MFKSKSVIKAVIATTTVAVLVISAVGNDDVRIANRLRHRHDIVGTWTLIDTVQSDGVPRHDAAIERKDFMFNSDGSVVMVEQKRGQSNPIFKEDWLYRSWGTFGIRGDTIMILIDRFKAERQNFERLDPNTNRWILESLPTYDSLITDGSQNRFITIQDLRDYFRRQEIPQRRM